MGHALSYRQAQVKGFQARLVKEGNLEAQRLGGEEAKGDLWVGGVSTSEFGGVQQTHLVATGASSVWRGGSSQCRALRYNDK